jgi:hypothetical protein
MVVDEPAGSVVEDTEPVERDQPVPSVVVTSTFSEKVSTIVLSPVLSAVNVGAVVSNVTEVLVIVDAALASESCASKANV